MLGAAIGSMGAAMVAALLVWVPSARADGGVTLDATVENSSGSFTKLSTLWQKPTVLFYEDRDSTGLNQHVKDALTERARVPGMADQVSVVAVANVSAWDWFPARNFVLAAVKDIEKKVNVPVYLDFKGSMTTAPWNLPAKSSTVVVLDAAGRAVWRAQGKLSREKIDELFAELERLLRPVSGAAAPTAH
jgi:hypothetical protein